MHIIDSPTQCEELKECEYNCLVVITFCLLVVQWSEKQLQHGTWGPEARSEKFARGRHQYFRLGHGQTQSS